MQLKNVKLEVKVKVGFKFEITFLTQHLGLSIQYLTQIWVKTTQHYLE